MLFPVPCWCSTGKTPRHRLLGLMHTSLSPWPTKVGRRGASVALTSDKHFFLVSLGQWLPTAVAPLPTTTHLYLSPALNQHYLPLEVFCNPVYEIRKTSFSG